MLRGSVIVYHSSRTEVAEIVTDLSHADSAEGHGLTTSSSWRRSCILLCCYLLLLVLLYRPTIVAMVSLWRTSTFGHGFLVIPISAYLVWTRRKSLALLKPIPTFYALPFLALFALAWLLGQL